MMARRKPKYCLHKGTGQAYVIIDGREHYLGKHGSPESHDVYDRLILEWRQRNNDTGRRSLSVGQLCLAFVDHADRYYRRPDGTPTGETQNFRDALRPLCQMFRSLPAFEFGPLKLKQVRDRIVSHGIVRPSVNKRIARIKQVFKWGVENELVPAETYLALSAVAGLKAGRTLAKEPDPVMPVPQGDLEASLPHLSPQVESMVRLQLLTGMRPSEVRMMQVGEIDRSRDVWVYQPRSHKTAHHGKSRTIWIGPRAQLVLRPYLSADPDRYVFRSDRRGDNLPYTLSGYLSSIRKACIKAGVPVWTPGQLRHNAASTIRAEFGDIDAARTVLGHSTTTVTEVYAERDAQRAANIVRLIG